MALSDVFDILSGSPASSGAGGASQDFDATVAPGVAGTNGATSSATDGRTALGREIFNYFRAKGLSPEQAAAVAGNMVWESGGNPANVTAGDNIKNSPRSPHSVGVGQWNDRAPALIDFARQQGVDIPAGNTGSAAYMRDAIRRIPLSTQLDFAWTEMQGPERRAFGMLAGSQGLDDALKGAISYHRPAGWSWSDPASGHGFANRQALAKNILASSAPPGSPAEAVASRFGDWTTNPQGASMAAAPAAPTRAMVASATTPEETGPGAALNKLFADSPGGGNSIQSVIEKAIKDSEERQAAANAQAQADPVLKTPLKQADLRSVLELIQRSAGRPLGNYGA